MILFRLFLIWLFNSLALIIINFIFDGWFLVNITLTLIFIAGIELWWVIKSD